MLLFLLVGEECMKSWSCFSFPAMKVQWTFCNLISEDSSDIEDDEGVEDTVMVCGVHIAMKANDDGTY